MFERLKLDVSGQTLPQSQGLRSASEDKPGVTPARAGVSALLSGLKKCGSRLRAAALPSEQAQWNSSSPSTGGAIQGAHPPHVWGHGNAIGFSTAPRFGPPPGSVTPSWFAPMGSTSLSVMSGPFQPLSHVVVVLPPPQSSHTSIVSAISQWLSGVSMPAVSSSAIMPSYGSYGPGSGSAPPSPWLSHGNVPMAAGWHEPNGAGYRMPAFANHGVPRQMFQEPGINPNMPMPQPPSPSYATPPRLEDVPPRPNNGVVPIRRPLRRVVPLSSQRRNTVSPPNLGGYLSEKQQEIFLKLNAKEENERPSEQAIETANDEAFAEGIRLSLIQHAASDVSRADATQALDESRSAATGGAPLRTVDTARQRPQVAPSDFPSIMRVPVGVDDVAPLRTHASIKRPPTASKNDEATKRLKSSYLPQAFYQPGLTLGNIADNAPEEPESPHQK